MPQNILPCYIILSFYFLGQLQREVVDSDPQLSRELEEVFELMTRPSLLFVVLSFIFRVHIFVIADLGHDREVRLVGGMQSQQKERRVGR